MHNVTVAEALPTWLWAERPHRRSPSGAVRPPARRGHARWLRWCGAR